MVWHYIQSVVNLKNVISIDIAVNKQCLTNVHFHVQIHNVAYIIYPPTHNNTISPYSIHTHQPLCVCSPVILCVSGPGLIGCSVCVAANILWSPKRSAKSGFISGRVASILPHGSVLPPSIYLALSFSVKAAPYCTSRQRGKNQAASHNCMRLSLTDSEKYMRICKNVSW